MCINEATLLAARRRSREITQADLEEAVEKVVAGPERKSRRLDEQRKKLLEAAYLGAKTILTEHRDKLELVARELIKREKLDAAMFRQLLDLPLAPVPVAT